MPTSPMQKLHLYLGLYDFWIKIQEIIFPEIQMQKKFFGLGVDKCFVIYPRPVQKTFSAFVLKKNMGGLG